MQHNQQVRGIEVALTHLLPSAEVRSSSCDDLRKSAYADLIGDQANKEIGYSRSKKEAVVWFRNYDRLFYIFHVLRDHVPLVKPELKVVKYVARALGGLMVGASERRDIRLAQRMASMLSLEQLLISRYLRGGNANVFWTPAIILSELQQLSYQRYEGARCTSGVVFCSEASDYLSKLDGECYQFESFQEPIDFDDRFFQSPASFRYVDGRNAFYFVDNWRKVAGILRCKDPKRFGLIQRSAGEHLSPLLLDHVGRVWAAFVGNNGDVNVQQKNSVVLRWLRNHWHLIYKDHVRTALSVRGVAEKLAASLQNALFAVSDLRAGALLLVAREPDLLPRVVGTIDDSRLGVALQAAMARGTIEDLTATGALVGVLTSDGLTSVAKDGRVLGCGQIVDIAAVDTTTISGGGRTQAARYASQFGLVIKISEDGPISLFEDGQELIKIVH